MEKWVDAFGVELMLLVFIRLNIFKSWESDGPCGSREVRYLPMMIYYRLSSASSRVV